MSIEQLLLLDVGKKTEKKGKLTYLSWCWAWEEALKADPAATFTVQTFDEYGPNGAKRTVPYMGINGTAMVWVTVTLFGKPMTCQLPVMDHKNTAITNPDAFQVNTAIMRCMTKGLSLHGLGLYIYAGEDLPQKSDESIAVKGPAPVISPRGGIGDDLPDEIKEFLQDLGGSVTELVKSGKASEALAMIDEQQLEADQKVYLSNQMDAPTRSALKKVKNG